MIMGHVVLRSEGTAIAVTEWASAVLGNSLGRYEEALAAAERGSEYPDDLGLATWSMVELIEAAARTGSPERAAGAMRRVSATTRASGSDWALGIEARSRALLSEGESAERLYCEAIERLAAPASGWNWPARTSSTENGCAVRTAVWTRGSNSAVPTKC